MDYRGRLIARITSPPNGHRPSAFLDIGHGTSVLASCRFHIHFFAYLHDFSSRARALRFSPRYHYGSAPSREYGDEGYMDVSRRKLFYFFRYLLSLRRIYSVR